MPFDEDAYEVFQKVVTDGLDGLLGAVQRLAAAAPRAEGQEVTRILARTEDAVRNLRGIVS